MSVKPESNKTIKRMIDTNTENTSPQLGEVPASKRRRNAIKPNSAESDILLNFSMNYAMNAAKLEDATSSETKCREDDEDVANDNTPTAKEPDTIDPADDAEDFDTPIAEAVESRRESFNSESKEFVAL
jgi:hypothetical protein